MQGLTAKNMILTDDKIKVQKQTPVYIYTGQNDDQISIDKMKTSISQMIKYLPKLDFTIEPNLGHEIS